MQQAGASVRSEYLGPVAPHPPWRPWLVSTKSRSMRDRQSKGQNLHTKFGLLHHALEWRWKRGFGATGRD